MNHELYLKNLKEELARRIDSNSSYSMRSFARAIGLQPSALSEILSGKRIPSHKMAETITSHLRMSPLEQEAFMDSIASAHRTRPGVRISPKFKQYKERPPVKELSIELFRVISDWYHLAIMFLSQTENFQPTYPWIAKQLGISITETKLAVERLTALGLMKRKKGKLILADQNFTTADKHLTNAGLKQHLRQILQKALFSLENDSIEIRNMTSMTMAIDPKKIPKAKIMIEEFTQKLSSFLESGKKSKVYELGIVLFPLQRK